MALTKVVSPRTLVYLSIFLCILVELGHSEDVPYTLEEISLEPSIIVLEGHGRYKRSVGTTDSVTDASFTTTSNGGQTTTVDGTQETTQDTTQALPTTALPSTPVTIKDDHKYYTSEILSPMYVDDHWIEQEDAVRHTTLSHNYRVAVSVTMNFTFRFYGHEINSVTIATGGFVYASPFLHKWLTATQYIAPLMGNFDTTLGNTSEILYKDYDDKFIVEWSNIYLQDQNHTNPFLFQTQLYKNGTIKFIYKKLPMAILDIERKSHPVKIGLSDAYYIDSSVDGKNRRTIYEYHRVEVDMAKIQQGTVVILHPKTTCNLLVDCESCIRSKLVFDCKWCGKVQRCSDGIDWKRQSWQTKGCTSLAHDNVTLCGYAPTKSTSIATASPTTPASTAVPTTTTNTMATTEMPGHPVVCDKSVAGNGSCALLNKKSKDNYTVGTIIAVIVILMVLIGAIGGWVFYAYRNPQTSSGMWLMEHRPSQMKEKMAKMKFWKKTTPTGEKYEIRSETVA